MVRPFAERRQSIFPKHCKCKAPGQAAKGQPQAFSVKKKGSIRICRATLGQLIAKK
jgi:hypothetical protein